ncbi:hypothetical protein BDZ85DRAFT_305326 [Elsinoe ampelina]|uniref:Uncharacterized protein n=1 Tax=Elsinoe ampelina TaxID=302913 RepID=A0A6A6GKP6_9PEZI|nr:hypothetical protein BDZ85DRAFT_305326 [Elsinoe ampelina]
MAPHRAQVVSLTQIIYPPQPFQILSLSGRVTDAAKSAKVISKPRCELEFRVDIAPAESVHHCTAKIRMLAKMISFPPEVSDLNEGNNFFVMILPGGGLMFGSRQTEPESVSNTYQFERCANTFREESDGFYVGITRVVVTAHGISDTLRDDGAVTRSNIMAQKWFCATGQVENETAANFGKRVFCKLAGESWVWKGVVVQDTDGLASV